MSSCSNCMYKSRCNVASIGYVSSIDCSRAMNELSKFSFTDLNKKDSSNNNWSIDDEYDDEDDF